MSVSPAAAIAESDLAHRQRSLWPPSLHAIDADWEINNKVILEAPKGYQAVIPIEWKSYLNGDIDLNAWQFTVFRRAVNQHSPAFVGVFTHAPHPWAFQLHPVIQAAGDLLDHRPLVVTERQLTEFLTVVTTGTTYGLEYFDAFAARYERTERANKVAQPCARCGEHVPADRGLLVMRKDRRGYAAIHRNDCGLGMGVAPLDSPEFFAKLDDRLPPKGVWSHVEPLKAYENFVPQLHLLVARRWLQEHTDHFSSAPAPAAPTTLIPNKPALGALRRQNLEGRAELQARYEAAQSAAWSRHRPKRPPQWAVDVMARAKDQPGPFRGSTGPAGAAPVRALPAPREVSTPPPREPAQVGRLHPLPAGWGVRECGVIGCDVLTGMVDDRGPICRHHQDPPERPLTDPSRRYPDRELKPHESGIGWACPVCLKSAGVFFGAAPDRKCNECFARWPEQPIAVCRQLLLERGG